MNLLDHMRGLASSQETDFVTAGELSIIKRSSMCIRNLLSWVNYTHSLLRQAALHLLMPCGTQCITFPRTQSPAQAHVSQNHHCNRMSQNNEMHTHFFLCTIFVFLNFFPPCASGCTLDAAGKIYSCRVDSVHTETFRVVTGLTRTSQPQDEERKEDEEREDKEDQDASEVCVCVCLFMIFSFIRIHMCVYMYAKSARRTRIRMPARCVCMYVCVHNICIHAYTLVCMFVYLYVCEEREENEDWDASEVCVCVYSCYFHSYIFTSMYVCMFLYIQRKRGEG
jgi:hypothetical protein